MSVPLDDLVSGKVPLPPADIPVILVCSRGPKRLVALDYLAEVCPRAICIEGGVTAWDEAKGRWGVELVGESKALAVRPANLRAAAPPSRAAMEEAEQIAYGAAQLLKQARATEARATEQASARASAAHLIKQAEEMLATAEAQDPAGFVMLTVRGDLAHMRRQPRLHAAAVQGLRALHAWRLLQRHLHVHVRSESL